MTQQTLNACLCELNISTWTARKLDRKASKEVKDNKGAMSDDAARVNKNLMAGMDNLKNITDYVAATRVEFYRMTLPWSDSGQRLIPMMQFFELKRWIDERETEFTNLVANFLIEYPTLISAQAFQLGTLFSRAEYPSVEEITDKFRFNVTFLPLPTSGDFRIDAPREVVSALEQEYVNIMDARVKATNQELWGRLHATLTHMSERLGRDESGKKNVFRDTMLENAVELCDLLKRLNVTNDPDLERARAYIESKLLGVEAKELREEDSIRDEIKSCVDEAISAWF
jgi:hypothetical protein